MIDFIFIGIVVSYCKEREAGEQFKMKSVHNCSYIQWFKVACTSGRKCLYFLVNYF